MILTTEEQQLIKLLRAGYTPQLRRLVGRILNEKIIDKIAADHGRDVVEAANKKAGTRMNGQSIGVRCVVLGPDSVRLECHTQLLDRALRDEVVMVNGLMPDLVNFPGGVLVLAPVQ